MTTGDDIPVRPIEILLVEDSVPDAIMTRHLLIDAKIANNLTVVEDGISALEFLRKQGRYANASRPDLVLLDLNLPRKDGLEVLGEIKDDADLKSIPVSVLTVSNEMVDIIASYRLEAVSFMTKPVDLQQLVELIKQTSGLKIMFVTAP